MNPRPPAYKTDALTPELRSHPLGLMLRDDVFHRIPKKRRDTYIALLCNGTKLVDVLYGDEECVGLVGPRLPKCRSPSGGVLAGSLLSGFLRRHFGPLF